VELAALCHVRRYRIANYLHHAAKGVPVLRHAIVPLERAFSLLPGNRSRAAPSAPSCDQLPTTAGAFLTPSPVRACQPAAGDPADRIAAVTIQAEEIARLARRLRLENESLRNRNAELEATLALPHFKAADLLYRIGERHPRLYRLAEPVLRAAWRIARNALRLALRRS
jgi:hypothetical protein